MHLVIALITGAASFVVIFLLFRRVFLRPDTGEGAFVGLFLVGFCIPAAYAFYTAHQKTLAAKERKRTGLAGKAGFNDLPTKEVAKPYVSPTRVRLPTPHYERQSLGYLPGECSPDEAKLKSWIDLMEVAPDDKGTIPRNSIYNAVERGDSQPAIIAQSDKNIIIVSAYSDEFDCYILLGYTGSEKEKLIAEGYSTVGTRLVCTWVYSPLNLGNQSDIMHGKDSSGKYTAGDPVVADFVTANTPRLDRLKKKFGDKMYATVLEGTRQLLTSGKVTKVRSGSPFIGANKYLPIS